MSVKMDFRSEDLEKMESHYEGKSPSGHIWWDVCNCVDCQKESLEEDRPKRKKKTSQQKLKERFEAGDPEVDLLGEPSGRFDWRYNNFGHFSHLKNG